VIKEQVNHQEILRNISPRDKEVLFLAPVFFLGKYLRRKINTEDFEPVVGEVDLNDPISVIRTGFDLHKQANSDIEEDVVGAISEALSKHPVRDKLFPHLDETQTKSVLRELDDMFENQEFCAQCEAWSHYDSEPEEFAISTADKILHLSSNALGVSWYGEIHGWKNRLPILKAIVKEKLPSKFGGLLNQGNVVED